MKLKAEVGKGVKAWMERGESSELRWVVHTEAGSPPVMSAGRGRTSDQRLVGAII